jgi:beta-glucosidase-like glycosyl hydrolase
VSPIYSHRASWVGDTDCRSLRYVKGVTVFPAGVTVASTWDTSLIYARGNAMGSEAKGVGVNVQLAPVAGKNTEGSLLVAMLISGQELSARSQTAVATGRASQRIRISLASP